MNFFFFIAEDVREMMAAMGFRKFDDLVGRADLLDTDKAIAHWKAHGLDFGRLFYRPDVGPDVPIRHVDRQQHPIEKILDRGFIEKSKAALESGEAVVIESTIRNVDRTTGAMLSGEVAKRYGHEGLPDDTISIRLAAPRPVRVSVRFYLRA